MHAFYFRTFALSRFKYLAMGFILCLSIIGCDAEFDDSGEADTSDYDTATLESLCNNEFDVSATERRATFTAYGDYAVMRGLIGSSTPEDMADLLDENPDLKTIVIAYSPGSEDDTANLEAALMLHEAGIDTCVPPGGQINSGGVDLFLAGKERWLADDAWVGVHSWGAETFSGNELPQDDPEHQPYLDFYRAIDISEDFYWYTLEAAGADDIHNMSSAEREQYQMTTP